LELRIASSSLVTRSLSLHQRLPLLGESDYKQNYKRPRRFLTPFDDVFVSRETWSEDVEKYFHSLLPNIESLDIFSISSSVAISLLEDGAPGKVRVPTPKGILDPGLRAEVQGTRCRSRAEPLGAQGLIPCFGAMNATEQRKRSVEGETETVQPGSELSTQTSLVDYECKTRKGQAPLRPISSSEQFGESGSSNAGQLSFGEIASLFQALAPIVRQLQRALPPGYLKEESVSQQPSAEAALLPLSDAAVLIQARLDSQYSRIPDSADKEKGRPAEYCPITGFNRSQISERHDGWTRPDNLNA
jgi:hypothetical protein